MIKYYITVSKNEKCAYIRLNGEENEWRRWKSNKETPEQILLHLIWSQIVRPVEGDEDWKEKSPIVVVSDNRRIVSIINDLVDLAHCREDDRERDDTFEKGYFYEDEVPRFRFIKISAEHASSEDDFISMAQLLADDDDVAKEAEKCDWHFDYYLESIGKNIDGKRVVPIPVKSPETVETK